MTTVYALLAVIPVLGYLIAGYAIVTGGDQPRTYYSPTYRTR